MVIRHIYLHCLDTVGRNARFGIGGTSKYAVRLVGNWLNSYRMKSFAVRTEFIDGESVRIDRESKINQCLEQEGVALCNMLLTKTEEHYLMASKADDKWIYCFDSYRRSLVRGMHKNVEVLNPEDGRSPNLRIRQTWFNQSVNERFCLGPIELGESLLIWRVS
ncbi:hypothetical protein [Desulfospira joergensenii]|uniref:hypothetical protein n=1 Tax=Desulfospira joergensenii TaxID=53329 RepID=UPI0004172638|nr:hypothetical protein [Desulfospira joergensenii]